MDIESDVEIEAPVEGSPGAAGWILRGLGVAVVSVLAVGLLLGAVILMWAFDSPPSNDDAINMVGAVVVLPVVGLFVWQLGRARQVQRTTDTPAVVSFIIGSIVVPALLTMPVWSSMIQDEFADRQRASLRDRACTENMSLLEQAGIDFDQSDPYSSELREHCEDAMVGTFTERQWIDRPSWVRGHAESVRATIETGDWSLRSGQGEVGWSDREMLVATKDDVMITVLFISGAENLINFETLVGPCVEDRSATLTTEAIALAG